MLSGKKGSPSGIIDQIRVRNVFGAFRSFGFKSCDQGREKFQGASLDFVWFDEDRRRATCTRSAVCACSTARGTSSAR